MRGDTTQLTPAALRIGEVVVDPRRRRLEVDGVEVDLPPRVFDLLLILVLEPNVTHSRESLFNRVWPGLVVEPGNLSTSIWLLRRALGEQRKGSIRTLSRVGYIFEPWAPISVDAGDRDEEPMGAAARTTGELPAAHASRGQAVRRRFSRAAIWAVVIATVAALPIWALMGASSGNADVTKAPAGRPVALILLEGQSDESSIEDAAVLLEDWIGFGLWAHPEFIVFREQDAASGSANVPDQQILLAASPSDDVEGEIVLSATLTGGARSNLSLQQRGPVDELPRMFDQLSAAVIEGLDPISPASAMPRFALQQALADYAEALRALARRDYERSTRLLRALVREAPDVGIVRLRLAQSLIAQRERRLAAEQFIGARSKLLPASADLAQLLTLELEYAQATTDSEFGRLAGQYEEMLQRFPAQPRFLLLSAELKLLSQDPQGAMAKLSQSVWSKQPFEMRLRAGLLQCEALIAIGDTQQGLSCSEALKPNSRAAGSSGQWFLGRAEALYALARYKLDPQNPEPDLNLAAARTYREGGYEVDALREELRAALIRWEEGAAEPAEASELLEVARSRGLRDLELTVHREVLSRALQVRNFTRANDHLRQAMELASSMGDDAGLRALSLRALGEARRSGDLSEFDRLMAKLESFPWEGEQALTFAMLSFWRHYNQGRFERADQVLDQGWQRATQVGDEVPRAPFAARILHARAMLALRRDQLVEAESLLDESARLFDNPAGSTLQLTRAELEVARGRCERAVDLIEDALSKLAGARDRQFMGSGPLQAAEVLVQCGQVERAENLLSRLETGLLASGGEYLNLRLLIGFAELAAAQHQWARSGQYIKQIEEWSEDLDYGARRRLNILKLIAAIQNGDDARAQEIFADLGEMAGQHGDKQLSRLLRGMGYYSR
jgi:cellulose synthase operon protein C